MNNVRTAALALAGAFLLAGGATTADAQATKESLKCASSKMKTVGKDWGSKLKCYSKAVGKGVPVDPACLAKAETKTTESFGKAIAKGGCATDADFFDQNEECPSTPAVPPIGDTIPDGQIGSILNQINCGFPTISGIDDLTADLITAAGPSKCTSKQVGALGKYAAAIFNCASKGASKNIQVDQECLDKAAAKLTKDFTKEESKVGNDCQTTGKGEFESGEVFRAYTRLVPLMPRFSGCGNGLVTKAPFPAESCDDGNTENFDGCPSDCTIDACTPTSSARPAILTISDPTAAVATTHPDHPQA